MQFDRLIITGHHDDQRQNISFDPIMAFSQGGNLIH